MHAVFNQHVISLQRIVAVVACMDLPNLSALSLRDATTGVPIVDSDGDFHEGFLNKLAVSYEGILTQAPPAFKTPKGNPVYAIGCAEDGVLRPCAPCFKHMNPKIGIGFSDIPNAGLGLFAVRDMQPNELVGIFTGVWATQCDIFHAWKDTYTQCSDAYDAEFEKYIMPFNPDPGKFKNDESTGMGKMYFPTDQIHHLVCVPRFAFEGTSRSLLGKSEKGVRCAIDVAEGTADIAALMNGSDSEENATCIFTSALVKGTDSQNNPIYRATIVLLVKETAVKAGTELTFFYRQRDTGTSQNTGDPSKGVKFEPSGARSGRGKRSGHTTDIEWIDRNAQLGDDVQRKATQLSMELTPDLFGPPIYYVRTRAQNAGRELVALAAIPSYDENAPKFFVPKRTFSGEEKQEQKERAREAWESDLRDWRDGIKALAFDGPNVMSDAVMIEAQNIEAQISKAEESQGFWMSFDPKSRVLLDEIERLKNRVLQLQATLADLKARGSEALELMNKSLFDKATESLKVQGKAKALRKKIEEQAAQALYVVDRRDSRKLYYKYGEDLYKL